MRGNVLPTPDPILGHALFSPCLINHVSEALQIQLLALLGDTVSQQTLWTSAFYYLSIPSSAEFPELYVLEVFYRCVLGD